MAGLEPSFVPSRPRASWRVRARARVLKWTPAVVWCGAISVVVVLLRDRTAPVAVKAEAEAVRWSVTAALEGELATLAVARGHQVESGQVLGYMRDDAIRLRLAHARADLDRLKAELQGEQARLQHTQGTDEASLETARLAELRRLYRDVEDARLDMLSTKAQIEEARVRQQGISVELRRLAQLDNGITSESEVTRLTTEHDALGKRVEELQHVLSGHEDRICAGHRRLETFERAKLPPALAEESVLDPFRWRVRAAEVELEQLSFVASQHRLAAPASGLVEEIHFQPGQRLALGQALLTIVEAKPRALVAYVPEQLKARFQPAMSVQYERSDAPGVLATTVVAAVSPALVRVPPRLWTDPRVEEWAVKVWMEPRGGEMPGQKVFLRWK